MLVGYWPFKTNAAPQPDLSGFTNHAAVVAGATWGNDSQRGGVMEFNGNNCYLEAADSPSLSLTGDLTIAAWIKVTDYAGFRGIVAKTEVNKPSPFDLYLKQTDGKAWFFGGSPVSGAYDYATSTTAVPAGQWHHLAVTLIGSQLTFYLDGVTNGLGTIAKPLIDSTATLRIGNRADLVTDFLGRMDDVAIFKGGLSAAQIGDIMAGDFSEFGLINTPPTLSYTSAGGGLVFNWPGSGFKLQMQTNNTLSVGLSTNWVDVPGGGTSGVSVPVTANPTAFFRLISTP